MAASDNTWLCGSTWCNPGKYDCCASCGSTVHEEPDDDFYSAADQIADEACADYWAHVAEHGHGDV